MFFGFPLDRRETAARSFCLPPLEYNPPLRGDRDVPSYATMRASLPHMPRHFVVVEVVLPTSAVVLESSIFHERLSTSTVSAD